MELTCQSAAVTADIQLRGRLPGKMATVRVARRNGRSVLLRAPLVTSWQDDPDFDDKARVIRQWWHDYGQGPPGQAD